MKTYIDPELTVTTCPFCGYENQLGIMVGGNNEDVCEHFIDFGREGFVFSDEVESD